MKKDLLVAVIIMLALPSKAQEYIKAMPVVPKKGFQTFGQYIETHDVSEMDGDTVTLANVYGTIGYAVMDRYVGRIDRSFFLMMQDAIYEDDKNVDSKKMLYVPISPSKYELTEINTNVIKKKLKEDFIRSIIWLMLSVNIFVASFAGFAEPAYKTYSFRIFSKV